MSKANEEMQAIFEALSEQNRDILLLVARGIKAVQESAQEAGGREEGEEKDHG